MEIKTKQSFNDLLESLVEEILDEDDLDEITTSADAGAYSTPMAFDPEGEERKKKYKRYIDKKKEIEGDYLMNCKVNHKKYLLRSLGL